jgi:hypothetical protein
VILCSVSIIAPILRNNLHVYVPVIRRTKVKPVNLPDILDIGKHWTEKYCHVVFPPLRVLRS